jgi:hypothetical protein
MSSSAQKRKTIYPLPVLLAVGAVAFMSLWGCLDFYQSVKLYNSTNNDPYRVAAQLDRFRGPSSLVPQTAVVGYISDVPFDEVRGSAAFFGAQYALAPRLLVELSEEQKPEWILGNFSKPTDYKALAQVHQLALVKDFGSGLVVFRKRAQ